MIVNEQLLEIIKNFTQITNAGLAFEVGNTFACQDGGGIGVDEHAGRSIVAVAKLTDPIVKEFAVYDAMQLYAALMTFTAPQITASDDGKLIISDAESRSGKFVINSASKQVVKAPGEIKFPEGGNNIQFRLTSEMYHKIFKGVGIVQSPEIIMYGSGGSMYIAAYDVQDKNANTYVVEIGETTEEFDVVIKVDSINKLIKSLDYDITIAPAGIMRAQSVGPIDICYYIAGTFKAK